MQKFYEDSHGILTILPSLWNRSYQPSGIGPRVVLEESQEDTEDTNNKRRLADLEGIEEERELAKRRRQRYQQRMTRAYAQAVHPRVFIKW